jgi:hypothetical protein
MRITTIYASFIISALLLIFASIPALASAATNCPSVPMPAATCATGWQPVQNGASCTTGYRCVVSTLNCASGQVMRNGACVPTSCPAQAVSQVCNSVQHIEYNGCAQICVSNTSANLHVSLQCAAGYKASDSSGVAECVSSTNTPTMTISETPGSIVAGAFKAPGGNATITYSTQNAPSDSSVNLYLLSSDGNSKVLLANKLPTSGSYTWKSVGPMCVDEECDMLLGGPGSYSMLAELYSPSNACVGGVCPGQGRTLPTVLATAQSGSFSITAGAASSAQGTSGGFTSKSGSTGSSLQGSGMTINVTWDASVASAPAEFKTAVQDVANNITARYSDPITLNITVGWGEVSGYALPGNAAGASNYYFMGFPYSSVKARYVADSKTGDDASAVAHLPGSDPANGGSYNTHTALAEALGLSTYAGTDGGIGFGTGLGWCYTEGQGCGGYDIHATIAHEFTEVMGRAMNGSNQLTGLFDYAGPGSLLLNGTGGYLSNDGGNTAIINAAGDGNLHGGSDLADWSSGGDSFSGYLYGGDIPVSEGDWRWMDIIGYDRATNVAASLSASPASIMTGQSSTLAWSSANATSCTGTGFTASGTAGSVTVTPTQTTIYTLTCTGTGGTAGANATVTVTIPPPPSADGSIVMQPPATGSLNTLSGAWTFGSATPPNGYNILLNGASAAGGQASLLEVNNGGQMYVFTGTSAWYLWSNGGWSQLSAGPTVTPIPTVTLSASPASITSGQSVTLSWNSTDATSCVGTGFNAAVPSGSVTVSPTSNATYSIECGGTGGLATASASVSVGTAPSMKVGARVVTSANLNVRNKANMNGGKIQCTQPAGSTGTISSGPSNAQGYTWWNVNFDTGCDGWAVSSYLALSLALGEQTTEVAGAEEVNPGSQLAAANQVSALQNIQEQLQALIEQIQALINGSH